MGKLLNKTSGSQPSSKKSGNRLAFVLSAAHYRTVLHYDSFVWCKIINLPLVRLLILQPEDY